MAKARLYLDVDGVLNLFGASRWPSSEVKSGVATLVHDGFGQVIQEGGWAASANPSYRINWAPELVDALNELDVELVWLTTWCHNASDLIAPMLGLTLESRVLEPVTGQVSFPSIFWKVISLVEDLKDFDGQAIWIDDEPNPTDFTTPEGVLRIQPDPQFGLSPVDLDMIHAYLGK